MTTTYKIDDAPYDKLLEFAQTLNLDPAPRRGITSSADLRALVKAATGSELVALPDEAPADMTVAAQLSTNPDLAHYKNDPKVKVNIASDEMNGGSHPFPIGCNGMPIWVRRDEDVEIPYRFYLALNNAVEKDFETYTDPVTGMLKERVFERQAIRFTVRSMPSDEEIAAFHERTKDIRSGNIRMAA